jgi:alpha-tubulin suppressor-like RCC1 family protein
MDPGILYTWGSRECLGREAPSDCSEPQSVPFFSKRRVQLLVSGDVHVTVRSGADFYAWGINTHGQLGREVKIEKIRYGGNEGNSSYDSPVADGTDDCEDSFMLDDAGIAEERNERGLSKRGQDSDLPVLVNIPSRKWSEADLWSVSLECGGRHMLLSMRSHLWAWGWNRYGQIGNGTTMDVHTPEIIQITPPAVDSSMASVKIINSPVNRCH